MIRKPSVVKDMAELAITRRALTIAGYDPSSGAGITADLQVFTAHSVVGVSAVTALTVQSRTGVRRVEPVSAALLRETLDLLAEEGPIAGVKIGMLATAELVEVVTKFLSRVRIPRERVVLDPVIWSSSGAELLSAEGVGRLREGLLPLVGWITPNVAEAGILAEIEVSGKEGVPELAGRLAKLGGGGLNVVVTGGNLEPPDDFLRTDSGTRLEKRTGFAESAADFSVPLFPRFDVALSATSAARSAIPA